jgi:molybdopterin molybdotransferase
MDGYALLAGSTEGASNYNRLPFTVVGDSMPGRPFEGSVGEGEAVRIMTGAPIPRGVDAVLPAEWIEIAHTTHNVINALAAVSPGKNIGRQGEDIVRGTVLLDAGRVLRPQDLGVISNSKSVVSVVRGRACGS